MDPVNAIVAALVAGATAAATGVATDAVKDAYLGLKRILIDTYKFASTQLLEDAPDDEAYQKAVHKELSEKPAAIDDPAVQKEVRAVQDSISALPTKDLTRLGIDIEILKSGGKLTLNNVKGGVRGKNWTSEGDMTFSNIEAGASPSRKK